MGPGKLEGIVECNQCGKRMSARGLRLRRVEQGELQVSYFVCPHCGWKYQVTTTDQTQRKLIMKLKTLMTERDLGRENNFREKTVKRFEREAKKVQAKMEERKEGLRQAGEAILHPGAGEAERNGQGDGQSGAAGV
jgi:transposase-like protein